MQIEKISFRYIRPLWEERKGMIVPCLEPSPDDGDKNLCTDTVFRSCNHANCAYALGFVDAEKHVLADLIANGDCGGQTLYARSELQLKNEVNLPQFIVETPETISWDEKAVALAAYNYVIQKYH